VHRRMGLRLDRVVSALMVFPFIDDASTGATVTENHGHFEGHGNGNIAFDILPPTGQTLAVGHYVTSRLPDATHAEMNVTVGGTGCSQVDGTLDVLAITQSAGDYVSFAANYTLHCDGRPELHSGVIRYSSAVGYALGSDSVQTIDFPISYWGFQGSAQTVTAPWRCPLVREVVLSLLRMTV
jgi:hypothetical protein